MSLTLAYLAGAMDSDGFFSVKRNTYCKRVTGDATNAVYSERIGLKQVTPQIPNLLAETFGGTVRLRQSQNKETGKPLYVWAVTDKKAAAAARQLAPFLMVKGRQAALLLELRESKEGPYKQLSYWFMTENPNWPDMETISTRDAADMLGFKTTVAITLAIRNGSLLAHPGRTYRVCKPMIEAYAQHQARGKTKMGRVRPPQLIAWRERIWNNVRTLNKIGINGTAVYHRTGVFCAK